MELILTLAVSLPIPAVAPVTRTTLSDMSGTSSAVNLVLPGQKFSLTMAQKAPMLDTIQRSGQVGVGNHTGRDGIYMASLSLWE